MLLDGGCSIYEHRPRACRAYDCRIFAATGIEVEETQPKIAARVRRWVFAFETEEDTALHEAVQAAARYVIERDGGELNATGLALRALSAAEDRTRPRTPR